MLKLDLPIFGQDLKKKLKNIIINVLKSKITFAVLVLSFLLVSIFLIYNQNRVKGETNKSHPVVIWIDNARITVKTEQENPKEVLEEASITLYPEDILTTDLITDPIYDGGVGQKIMIKRAPVFNVSVDGVVRVIRTWDPLVSEILKKSEVVIGPKDIISELGDSKLLPGATIVITRVKQADIDVFEEIPFNTINKGDAGISFGSQKIVQEGATGKLKKTYRVTYNNGVEVSRVFLSKETVVAKKDKIIASGIIIGRANFGYYSGMVTSFYKGMTGRHLLVTNLANGKQIKVKIIGSGPFNGPIMDMGTEPFQAIGGKLSDGYIPKVSVQLID